MPKKRSAYKRRIHVQAPVRTKDSYNNMVITGYTNVLTAEPADRDFPLGFGNSDRLEKVRGGQVQGQVSCVYRIRTPRGVVIDPTMRVIDLTDNGVEYEVDAAVDSTDQVESGELLIFVRALTDAR